MENKRHFKRWLLQGFVVTLPIVLTTIIFYYIVVNTDAALWFVWDLFFSSHEKPFWFPGVGLLFAIALVTLIGFLTESWVMRKCFDIFNYIVSNLPFVKNIYSTIHKIVNSALGSKSNLSKVVLIEYPSDGSYCLAFLTGQAPTAFTTVLGEEAVNVFLPTTPNPTSGFYLIVAKRKVKETTLTSEEAFKLIISAGIVQDDKTPLERVK